MLNRFRIFGLPAAVLALAFITTLAAIADDFDPPPWRGEPLTCQFVWDFTTFNPQGQPPDHMNCVGDGVHELYPVQPEAIVGGLEWMQDTGMVCATSGTGRADVILGNYYCVGVGLFKWISIQVTYEGQGAPLVADAYGYLEGQYIDGMNTEIDTPAYGQRSEIWTFQPSPEHEFIRIEIPEGTCLDEVIIDTQAGVSLPPPVGACCFEDGSCVVASAEECYAMGGAFYGEDTHCDPNPCGGTPVLNTTWGRVKAMYN